MITRSEYLHHPKYGYCVSCNTYRHKTYESSKRCRGCLDYEFPCRFWDPISELDRILGLNE